MHLGVYELDRITFPVPDERSLIPIRDVSGDLSLNYIRGFLADCFPNEEDPDRLAVEMETQQRKNETLFFWKGTADVQPVSMASNSARHRNGATISLVYTPPEFRGIGSRKPNRSRLIRSMLEVRKEILQPFYRSDEPDIQFDLPKTRLSKNRRKQTLQAA